jgi:hypothetical protein
MLRRPLGGSGYEKPQSGLRPLWDFSPPHFAVAGLCFAKPLYATTKRHIQPERYVQYALNLFKNLKF